MSGADNDRETLPKEEIFCLKGHDGPVLAVRFNKAGTYCLSCGKVSRIITLNSFCHPFKRAVHIC